MNTPPSPPSKLVIRSEVLAVVSFLTTVDNPPKQDRIKQVKRLSDEHIRETVLDILVKELQRAPQARERQAITELLMELGQVDQLHAPLWDLITQEGVSDEVKDCANLVLHHLGDEMDPDVYLDYLRDPQGLINRETERMLEVSAGNPEALIDFIDFVFSLPEGEQGNLLASLQSDFQPDYLVNLLIPAYHAHPPLALQHTILKTLSELKSPRAAVFLHDLLTTETPTMPNLDDESVRLIKRAISSLRLAGVYKEELLDSYRETLDVPHGLIAHSKPYACYATIVDGIGNQGLIISRQHENGDIAMMCVATNDLHGIIDCFGFFQLSEEDFQKIVEKFHEESCKIKVPEDYCAYQLKQAEALNRQNQFRIPYEYSCWKILLDDAWQTHFEAPESQCKAWAVSDWATESANLYHHPDFTAWFLERGDHDILQDILQELPAWCKEVDQKKLKLKEFVEVMDLLAERLIRHLMRTGWRRILKQRLADAAFLFQCQQTLTFSRLAATEVMNLENYSDEQPLSETGFLRCYGRRCIEEELIRYGQHTEAPSTTTKCIDALLKAWETS